MLSIYQKIRAKIHYIILKGKEIINYISFVKNYHFSIKNTEIGIIFIPNINFEHTPNEFYINIFGLKGIDYTFRVKITELDLVYYMSLFHTININYKYYVNKKQ